MRPSRIHQMLALAAISEAAMMPDVRIKSGSTGGQGGPACNLKSAERKKRKNKSRAAKASRKANR